MNNKALTLSLFMAAVAVFFVSSYVTSVEDDSRKKFGTSISVLVARRDIKEMETINETMIDRKEVPKSFIEPAAITLETKDEDGKESGRAIRGLIGQIAMVPLKKGEQISYNKLADPSIRTGLAPQIAPGRRAVAIPVSEISGVSKLIKPGDRIDLIAIIDLGTGKENKISKTVLQDAVVLSIGRYVTNNVARSVEADPAGGKDRVRSLAEDYSFASVTLEVDPGQAQALALLMSGGDNSMFISLRNNDDTERGNIASTTLIDILGPDAGKVKGHK